MKLFYHPGIAGELDGATDYYESKQVGLGLRFRLAFDYAIYFRVEPDGVYIVVLRHHRQHPAYGLHQVQPQP